jgi:hypothetical protein
VNLLDKMAQHGLGHFEVCDDPVPHGPDGDNIARRAAQHVFRFGPHGQHAIAGPIVRAHRNDDGSLSTMPLPLT